MAVTRNMNPKKCPMPSQEPDVRNKNFNEVALGYPSSSLYCFHINSQSGII